MFEGSKYGRKADSEERSFATSLLGRRAMIDPGNARLWFATALVFSSFAAVVATWAFAHATNQLELTVLVPNAPGGKVTVVSHQMAMMIGGMSAFVMLMVPLPSAPRLRAMLMSAMPPMLIVGLGLGSLVGDNKALGIMVLCLTATVLVLLQRVPPTLLLGYPVFFGLFLAIFIKLPSGQLPWVAAIVGVASITCIVFSILVFRPHPERNLRRIRRAFDRAEDEAIEAAIRLLRAELVDGSSPDLQHAAETLTRLNEVALMVDVNLADSGLKLDQEVVDQLHHQVFDREASVHAVVRASADALRAGVPLDDRARTANVLTKFRSSAREQARELAETDLKDSSKQLGSASPENQAILRARYHAAVVVLEMVMPLTSPDVGAFATPSFRPAVLAPGGALAGSGPAAASALEPRRNSLAVRIMPPVIAARALRMLIATGLASAMGAAISPTRWYWAFFTAFAVMAAANTAAEHVRTSIERAIGTAIGVAVGIGIAHVLSDHLAIAFVSIFVSMGVAFYYRQPSSLLNTMAITIMVSQLYLLLGSYTDRVLLTRMTETLLGATIAIGVSLTVFRVRTSTVATHAIKAHLAAFDQVIENTIDHVAGGRPSTELRSDVRALQDAHQQLRKTVVPSSAMFQRYAHGTTRDQLILLGILTHDAANIARRGTTADPLDNDQRRELRNVGVQLRQGVLVISDALVNGVAGSAPFVLTNRIDDIDTALRDTKSQQRALQLAFVHELAVLQEHLLDLALALGVPVEVQEATSAPRVRYVPIEAP